TTRPAPYRICLCLASVFSMCTRNLETEIFRKNVGDFWGRSGVPPVVAPEGGLALPRVKPGVPQCSCASEPPRVRKVPKKQISKVYSFIVSGNHKCEYKRCTDSLEF